MFRGNKAKEYCFFLLFPSKTGVIGSTQTWAREFRTDIL